jgi:hypothetical protein
MTIVFLIRVDFHFDAGEPVARPGYIEQGLMAMDLTVAPVAQIKAKTVPNARYPHRISTQFPL